MKNTFSVQVVGPVGACALPWEDWRRKTGYLDDIRMVINFFFKRVLRVLIPFGNG